MEGAPKSAPTGCYKCGRPGHWSRDCPSSAPAATNDSSAPPTPSTFRSDSVSKSGEKLKPKKAPKTRPKLTPELLLSDEGIGFILKHFPRNFKCRGRGHEVDDLGHLLGMYREWHSHLLPYYSFDHFVHKVEQIAATKQVKRCIGELRERVANGGDLTKLREQSYVEDVSNNEQDHSNPAEGVKSAEQDDRQSNLASCDNNFIDIQDDMLHEIYQKATEEPAAAMPPEKAATNVSGLGSSNAEPEQVPSDRVDRPQRIQITEEQKARMEANRLKALERATARARSQQEAP